MKIYILSPSVEVLFDIDLKRKLNTAGDVVYVVKSVPLSKIPGLFTDLAEKILAIDPDYFKKWSVKNEDIEKIKNLKAICLQTTSFAWVDTDFCKKLGIPVINLRGFSTEAVSEWALLMAVALARRIPLVAREGWNKEDYERHKGIELKGKTAGIIGLGRIGARIAEICKGLGMVVYYWSKNSRDKRFTYVSLEKLLKTSDLIFPSVAKNEKTQRLIKDKMIRNIKKSAIFVSIIHIDTYNHDLLIEMVEKGKLFGYGFEFDGGGIFNKYKGNIWAGPALGWVTDGSFKLNAEQWVKAIVKASKGDFSNKVN